MYSCVACAALGSHGARATVNPVFADGFEEFACSSGDNPQPNTGIAAEPGSAGCPDGMVAVETFCIDRYEAALIDDSPGAAGAAWSPYFNPAATSVHALSAQAAVPQGYISQIQADAACAAAGKRLCSDGEWLRACRGPAATLYPYGDTPVSGACNDTRAVNPVVEYFGGAADFSLAQITHPCLNQLRNGLDRAGANPACVSAEGVYDLVGNLDEWTSGTTGGGHGIFRGGDYVDSTLNGAGCTYTTTAHEPTFFDYSTGFRCCADPVAAPLVIRLPQ
jgi:formylglycine-generating enzyme required for sulfatase activity